MNYLPLYQLLDRIGKKLNPIVITARCLHFLVRTSLGWGVAVVGARLCGMHSGAVFIWEAGLFLGCCAGLLDGWRRRPDQNSLAGWLDKELGTGEALTAALICIERNCAGLVDPLVIERAILCAEQAAREPDRIMAGLRRPRRQLRNQAVTALVIQGIVLACLLLTPVSWRLDLRPSTTARGRIPILHTSANPATNRRTPALSARTIANQLFPESPRLARGLEQALRMGDVAQVEQLLGKAQTESNLRMKTNTELQEKLRAAVRDYQRITPGHESQAGGERQSQLGDGQGAANSGSGPERRSTRKGKRDVATSSPGNDPGLPSSRRQSGNNPSLAGRGSKPPDGGTSAGAPGSAAQRGGNRAGAGKGADRGNWGVIVPGKPGQKFRLRPDGNTLEFIMPGQNAKLPVHQVLPALREAAEAALTRRGVPGEYQDYVRSYFQELAQE